jgi:hypothetical protein
MLNVLGYLAQLGESLVSEFGVCICHYQPFFEPAAD